MKRFFSMLIALAFVMSCSSISFAQVPPEQISPDFITASQSFALDMYRSINYEAENHNVAFSPMSIQFVMGMLNSSADKKTSAAIKKTWHLSSKMTNDQLNKQLGLVMDRTILESQANSKMKIANSMFISNKYKINPNFKKATAPYKPLISTIDFTKKSSVDTVNKWVSDNTDKHIPKIVEEFNDPENMATAILNAVVFEGRWSTEFDKKKTTTKTFYGAKSQNDVNMMSMNGKMDYYEDTNVQAMRMPYMGQYNMLIILPRDKKEGGLFTLAKKLDQKYFNKIANGTRSGYYIGTYSLPRFEVEYSNDELVDTLKGLGVDLKYNPKTKIANFNGAVWNAKTNLALSSFKHKAMIKVDEQGTIAAAVTEFASADTDMVAKPKPFTMNVNRPFIFCICDNSNQIYFLGTIYNINADN